MSAFRQATGRDGAPRSRDQRGTTLVELLISMAIMGVISTMILLGWFALTRSYSFSVKNSDARDSARQAISRVQREVRDAQKPPQSYLTGTTSSASDAIIYRARAYSITFSTSFKQAGNDVMDWASSPSPSAVQTTPRLVTYRLYSDGELWRFEDENLDGTIANVTVNESTTVSDPSHFSLAEQTNGEGARLILQNVVNYTAHSTPIPLFQYNYYNSDGTLESADTLTGTDRYDVIAVQIRILEDLNPERAPVYADLRSTAELRNSR